ncbi:DUF2635 domain-containing protein [Pseudomonas aeruginosa]|uniref:DUF2635 domain-containing protein n=1 Tax=Pseudomonas TaxID=286 RepID=UPI000A11CBAD|nr:DUF2635 domain-containing protein [Pseudomonas aeruginosa]ORL70384.1 hypothetical protein B7H19_05590 [Pseudomonas putida]QKK99015.1 DUF2635 domain-containing protein [Pseudomonas sp. 13159349]
MTQRITVVPAAGRAVPDPQAGDLLPAAGREVTDSVWWRVVTSFAEYGTYKARPENTQGPKVTRLLHLYSTR